MDENLHRPFAESLDMQQINELHERRRLQRKIEAKLKLANLSLAQLEGISHIMSHPSFVIDDDSVEPGVHFEGDF